VRFAGGSGKTNFAICINPDVHAWPWKAKIRHTVPSVYQTQLINWLTIFIFGSMTCAIPSAHHSALIRNKRNFLSSNHSLYIWVHRHWTLARAWMRTWRVSGYSFILVAGRLQVLLPISLNVSTLHYLSQTSRCGVNSSVSRDQCVVKRKYSSKVALGSQIGACKIFGYFGFFMFLLSILTQARRKSHGNTTFEEKLWSRWRRV
jgi:hypothetical protein